MRPTNSFKRGRLKFDPLACFKRPRMKSFPPSILSTHYKENIFRRMAFMLQINR